MMHVDRSTTSPANRPPERTFTGEVLIRGYFQRPGPSRLSGATVAFAPGARTPWKVNPAGQTVIITRGVGWAQAEGTPMIEIRAGDLLWFPPGERHWEGATPDQSMTCVVVQEDGVAFGDAVTDAEYRAGPLA